MGKWYDYFSQQAKEEEEKKKEQADREKSLPAESDSGDFWTDYQRWKRTGEIPQDKKTIPEPEEEQPKSLTERLAARGITVEMPEPKRETAKAEDSGPTLAEAASQGRSTSLFTDRIGSTFTAQQRQRDALAALEEEARKNRTVRNEEWLDSLRTPEEIRAELEEAKKETGAAKRKDFFEGLAGDLRSLVDSEFRMSGREYNTHQKENSERIRALEDELAERQWADYERLRNNADFAAKSQYKSTANGQETKKNPLGGYDSVGFDDVEYEYVNGNQDAATILANESREAGEANGILGALVKPKEYEYTQLGEMNDEEKSLYNYIHATQGKQAAHEYLEYLRSDLYARQSEKEKNEAATYAEEHPVLSTVQTVGTSPLRGVGYLGQAAQFMTEGTVDANAPYNRLSYMTSAERDVVTRAVERNWGKVGSFAYGVGVSMAEFLLNSGMTGGGASGVSEALSLALMGSGAAADATIEAKERGLSDNQSFAIGSIAGLAEILTEKISIENLFNGKWETEPLRYLFKNTIAEGSEEAGSDLINWFADVMIARDKSEWQQAINKYMTVDHMNEHDAFMAALKDKGLEILLDAGSGALSGFLMAVGPSTVGLAQRSADRSADIEATRRATQAVKALGQQNAAPNVMAGIEAAQQQTAQPEGIELPTGAEAAEAEMAAGYREDRTGDTLRFGPEPEVRTLTPTVDEAETNEAVQKAMDEGNITRATGIRYGVKEKDIARMERLSQMTGRRVQFFDGKLKNGAVVNGYTDKTTGDIFLNTKAKRPMLFTFAHEFTHNLEGTDAYRALMDHIKTRAMQQGVDWAQKRADMRELYERGTGQQVDDAYVDEEILADWIGENLSDERTIREICRENPSAAKRIRDALDSFIIRAANAGGIVTSYEEQKVRNMIGMIDRYIGEANRNTERNAQNAREAAQAGETAQASRSGEVQNVQETAAAVPETAEWTSWDNAGREISGKWDGIKSDWVTSSLEELYQEVAKVAGTTADGRIDFSKFDIRDFEQPVMKLAEDLVDSASVTEDNPDFAELREARAYLRKTPIYYDPDALRAEFGDRESYNRWLKSLFGSMRLTTDRSKGVPADVIFDEFADQFPGYVDLTVDNDVERLTQLADAAEDMKNRGGRKRESNPYELGRDEAVVGVAMDLIGELQNRLTGREPVREWNRKAEAKKPASRKTPSKKTAAAETKTKAEDISAVVNLGESSGTAETADQLRARAEELLDSGEIDENRYDDMQALADELESTGQSFDRSTVERDEGPRGKIGELIDNLPMKRRFSLSESTERVGELVAVHNLTPEQLYSSWEMGGFPAPSIAVVKSKQGHSKYGSVSVVFGADAIDPQKDYRNNIFGADAYTPTYSNAAVAWEMKADQADALEDKLHDLSLNTANGAFTASSSIIRRYYDSVIDVSPEEFAQRLAKLTEIKSAYLADKGVNVDRVMREIEPEYNERFTNTTIKNFADSFGADFIDGVYDNETDETTLTDEQYKEITDWFIQDKASKPPMNKNPETAFQRAQRWADNNLYPVLIDNVVRSAWNMTHGTQEPKTIVDTDVIENNINKLASTEEVYDWLLPQIKEIYGKRGVRNAKDQFTRSGNRRKFKDLYDDFNIANIVEAMFRNGERGLGANPGSAEGLQSKTASSYSNLDEVRNDSGRLQTVNEEEYKAITDALDERIEEIRHKIAKQNKGDTFIVNIDVGNAILDAASPYATKTRIQSEFKKNGLKIDDNTAGELLQLYKDTANVPTMYFEAKPARNVQLNEIAAVIVPDDMQQYIKDAYKGSNVPVVEYKAGDENDRLEKLNSLENVRFSITEADDRAYMDAVRAGDEATQQRMVDEAARAAGYPIKAYHGTPNGTFTVFRDWQYFTEDKSYADVYQNQGASSNGYKRTALNPKTYVVYIAPENAFDTRNARERKIFENEFYGKWGNGSPLSKRGLPDWTDADDLIEFFEENGYDYDTIYIDEGGTGGYGEEVNDRGISIVVKDSAQVKSADPVTYDDDGNVIPLSQRFNPEEDDIRYSVSEADDVRKVKPDMNDEERTEVLRNRTIHFIPAVAEMSEGLRNAVGADGWGTINTLKGNEKRALLHRIAREFGVFKTYSDSDIDLEFEYTGNNFRESYGKQRVRFEQFGKLMSVLDDVIRNAVGIDVHLDEDYKPDSTLDNVYVMMGAFEDGDQIVPVKLAVKEFNNKPNKLYVTVTANGMEKAGVSKLRSYQDSGVAYDSRPANISIAQLMSLVNPADTTLTKYFPEGMRTAEQQAALEESGEVEHSERYSLSEDEGTQNDLAELSQKAKTAALRIERQLTSDILQGIQRNLNSNSAEFRQFRADVARPVVEQLLRGDTPDVDAVLESTGIDIVGQAAARGAVNDALRRANGELARIRTAVQESNARQQAREARNAELDAKIPDTSEGLIELANAVKDARKRWNTAKAKTIMTEEDLDLAHKIATGQMSPEEAFTQNALGMDDIINMAEAEKAFLDASAPWERYVKRLAQRRYETADARLENADQAKDKASGFQYARETPERNFRDVFGSDAAALIDDYIRPVHRSEAESTRFKNEYNKRVKDLGLDQKVRRGNTNSEAAAVQFLGEAEDNVRVLELARTQNAVRDGKTLNEWRAEIEVFKKANPNLDYDKVERGIESFRQIYNELITRMNEALVESGYMPVNVRRGYFPHFQTGNDTILSTFAHLLGINIDSNALPTAINGLTSMFKPGKPWFSHAMERTGFATDYDAIEGFDGYLGGVSDVIHQTGNIRNLRALGTRIRYMMGDEQIKRRIDAIEADETRTEQEKLAAIQDLTDNGRYKLSRFVSWLDEYTNLLANKKSKFDRGVEDLMGRRVYTWMKNIEGRVAANMISGNLGSALTNFIPLNQAGAVLGDWSMLRGAFDLMTGRARGDGFVERSDFLTNRRGVDPLTMTSAQKISDVLSKPMNLIDDFTSETIVRAAYNKYLKQGMDEQSAMQAADELAAGLMADRSKGAQPTIFGSHNPLMKLFTQFQVEVNNELSTIFKDIPKGTFRDDRDKKKAVAVAAWTLLRYFIGAYLFNDLYEKVVGRRAALDPLDIANDAIGDLTGKKLNNTWDALIGGEGFLDVKDRKNRSDAIIDFGKNALEELPFVGGLLGGGRIPIKSAIPSPVKIINGLANENLDGDKKLEVVGRELGNTIGTYWLPPFAGGAGKKAVQTVENVLTGGRYVKDNEGNDQLQYPYFTDTPLEATKTILQSTLFGATATDAGRDWVERGFGNQSVKNTNLYKELTQELGESQRESWNVINDIKPKDKNGNKMMVAESGLSDEGKAAAMEAVVNDGKSTEPQKFRAAYNNGVSADAWAALYGAMSRYDVNGNNTYTQVEIKEALDNITVPVSSGEGALQGLFGGSTSERHLTNAEKAALWSAYDPSWATKNNPYDPAIGARVVAEYNRLKNEKAEESEDEE